MLTRIASLLGRPLNHVATARTELYLTFDDGPEPGFTDRILKVLQASDSKATFFVIADRAEKSPQLIREILSEGHSIGNHSLDHGYANFFRGRSAMRSWIQQSEEKLQFLTGGIPTVGFRPPAGVITPELVGALKDLQIPLVLWTQRFFDTTLPWTTDRALGSLSKIRGGSIILLHDRQRAERQGMFEISLAVYLEHAKSRGFQFQSLTRELCSRTSNGESSCAETSH
jgi:peptidoglycan-N-acetylglucosamine deacetylase